MAGENNARRGENFSLKEREKKSFLKDHLKSQVTEQDFKGFVDEQQKEFLVRAFGSSRFDQKIMDSANVRIKDSWKNLNNELVKFGKKEFKQITNEFDHLVRSINSELSELQYNIKDFSKNANMLGNFDGQDGLELPPQYVDYIRKTGVGRWLLGSHKQNKFTQAMREQDFIMTENKKDMLSVAGVQIAQAYDSAVKLKGKNIINKNIIDYYKNAFGEDFDFNKPDIVKKFQQHLLTVPSQISSIFQTGSLNADVSLDGMNVANSVVDPTNKNDITNRLRQGGFEGDEIKEGVAHLTGLFADLSSGDVSGWTGPILDAIKQATGVVDFTLINWKKGGLHVYPTMVGMRPGMAVMVDLVGSEDKRVTGSASAGVLITPNPIKGKAFAIDYLVTAGTGLDISNHKRFDGRTQKNIAAGGYVLFDKKGPKSAGANLMYLSNKAEGITNDTELFKSTMDTYMGGAYVAFIANEVPVNSDSKTDPKGRVIDYLMSLDRKQQRDKREKTDIRFTREQAEKFVNQILPIFKSIAASKLDATPILSQVVDRYAQRWKNEQVLGANKIGITGFGIGAIVTRTASYIVPTIRITNRKVIFGDDKSMIDQQVRLAQAGKGGVDIGDTAGDLKSAAHKYNTMFAGLGFDLGFSSDKDYGILHYDMPKSKLQILIKQGTADSYVQITPKGKSLDQLNRSIEISKDLPSAVIEKIGPNGSYYVLVIGDDKLPKDGDDTFVSYTSETKTSDLVATTEVVKGNETVSTESITRLKEGSENIILGYTISLVDKKLTFKPTTGDSFVCTIDEFNEKGVMCDLISKTIVLGGEAKKISIVKEGGNLNGNSQPFRFEGYARNSAYVDQKFKFAVLNLKHSGRPEDKAKNAVFKKELVDFAQAMNNGTSEETLIADANKIIGQINGYNSNLKLQGLTTMDELFDFNEGLSVTWRSYDRQFNGGKNVNSRSTSIYSDIKQQQSKVVSRVSKEKNSEGQSFVDSNALSGELKTIIGSDTYSKQLNKKSLTDADIVKSENRLGFVFGTVLDNGNGLDEKMVTNSPYLKDSEMSISDKPQLRAYLVNTLLTNSRESTNIYGLINTIIKAQGGDSVIDKEIATQLISYAQNGGVLQFGNITITLNSQFEIHPGCLNYKLSMGFTSESVKIPDDPKKHDLLIETPVSKDDVVVNKPKAKYYTIMDGTAADLGERNTTVGVAVGLPTKESGTTIIPKQSTTTIKFGDKEVAIKANSDGTYTNVGTGEIFDVSTFVNPNQNIIITLGDGSQITVDALQWKHYTPEQRINILNLPKFVNPNNEDNLPKSSREKLDGTGNILSMTTDRGSSVIKEKKKEELTSVPTKKETISLQSPKSASYLDGGIEQKFTFDSKIHQSLVEIEAKTPKEFNNGLNKYIGKPFLTIGGINYSISEIVPKGTFVQVNCISADGRTTTLQYGVTDFNDPSLSKKKKRKLGKTYLNGIVTTIDGVNIEMSK